MKRFLLVSFLSIMFLVSTLSVSCSNLQNFVEVKEKNNDEIFNPETNVLNPSTAYSGGSITSRATTNDHESETTSNKKEIEEINLVTSDITIEVGSTYKLDYSYLPIDAEIEDDEFSFISANSSIASINNNGVVKGISVGTTKVTITSKNNISATCNINVVLSNDEQINESLSFGKYKYILYIDDVFQLDVNFYSNDLNSTLSWESSALGVGIVDQNGLFTALNTGDTVIKVTTSNNTIATCFITVKEFAGFLADNGNRTTFTKLVEQQYFNLYDEDADEISRTIIYSDNRPIENNILMDTTNKGILIIPEEVKYINDECFANYLAIREIQLPDTIISIKMSAFDNCPNIEELTIPQSVKNITTPAENNMYIRRYKVHEKNPYFTSENANAIIDMNTKNLIFGGCESSIPNYVTGIGDDAFVNVRDFTSITIPDNVISLGKAPFRGSDLQSLIIGSGLSQISSTQEGYEGNIYGCYDLNELRISDENSIYSSINGKALINKNTNTLLTLCKDSLIPTNITEISYRAIDLPSLSEIEVPDNITSIKQKAFYYSNNLTRIILPTSLQFLEEDAFPNNNLEIVYMGTQEEWLTINGYNNPYESYSNITFIT